MMSMIFLMLICIASSTLYGAIDVSVHSRHPGIELASPVHLCDGISYNGGPAERVDTGVMMKIDFRFDLNQDEHKCILMCEVRRKENTRYDYQSNTDATSFEAVEDTSKMIRLLAAWKINRSWKFNAQIVLAEHDRELVLNEDKLGWIYDKVDDTLVEVYASLFRYNGIYKSTWLAYDNTVLEITSEVVDKEGFGLKIAISEGTKDKDTKKLMWIDSKRQVSFLMAICFVLICIFSLILRPTIDVIIDNQCTDIELTSPVYFTKDMTCHVQLPQQVDSNSRMKVSFRTSTDRDTFGGALLYRLQRKEDTSIGTQLLVIWGCKHNDIYSYVLLIEHESTLIRSEDMLKGLCDAYNSRYEAHFLPREHWLLDNNIILRTVGEASHGGFEIEAIISDEKDPLCPIKPLWVDSNR
jgi:hypothetical protein